MWSEREVDDIVLEGEEGGDSGTGCTSPEGTTSIPRVSRREVERCWKAAAFSELEGGRSIKRRGKVNRN